MNISDPLGDSGGFQSTASEAASENLSVSDCGPCGNTAVRAGHSGCLSLLFAIPRADTALLARLPDGVRRHLTTTFLILRTIHAARNKAAEIRSQAEQRRGLRGFSAESLARKYYAYIEAGDWRCLIDRAKAGPAFWDTDAPVGLPPAFIEFWKSLCERNQRKTAPARRELIRIWTEGVGTDPATGKKKPYHKFPGYPEWSPSGNLRESAKSADNLPVGWSIANLNRYAPSKFELAVARHGREAAAQHRRKVFTTRRGLVVGQYYLFDDQEYDLKVNWPGARAAMRPLGLNCLDLYSACCVGIGLKPTLLDAEGTKKKLREKDMLWLVADVLCNKGYIPAPSGNLRESAQSADKSSSLYTTLIVEHGTAAIRADFEQRILTATQDQVRVQRSGISNEHLAGLFEGASKGNPRFKAALESLFNLVRNEMANLPGQIGMDRQHAPAEAVGRERYNNQLLKLAQSLPPERRDLLQLPYLTWSQFQDLTLDLYHRINHRTDHALEGWEKSGLTVQELFVQIGSSGGDDAHISQADWLKLEPAKRAALEPFTSAKSRKLSPQEVWNAGAPGLHKLGPDMLPVLLGPDFGEERAVRGGYITIEDKELGPDPLRFPAGLYDDGDKFLCYLNPHNASALILTDAQGRFVDTLALQETPCRSDVIGIHRQLGAARKEEAARLAPVIARALPLARDQRDMRLHNKAVFEGQAVTADEITAAESLRARLKKDGNQALEDATTPVGLVSPSEPCAEALVHSPEPESTLDDKLIDDAL